MANTSLCVFVMVSFERIWLVPMEYSASTFVAFVTTTEVETVCIVAFLNVHASSEAEVSFCVVR